MTESERILSSEYSERFDEIRKGLMLQSHYKYGWLKDAYGADAEKPISAVKSLIKYLEKYNETGNLEFIADVANFAMIEFMFPERKDAFFKYTESHESPQIQGKNGQAWR
jgi:hypothetical protein